MAEIGKPVRRIEDFRLLTGGGRFTDDLSPSGSSYEHNILSNPLHPANGGDPDPDTNLGGFILATLMTPGDLSLQQDGYAFGGGQNTNGEDERPFTTIVTGGEFGMQGGGGAIIGGSIYANGDVAWNGNGAGFLFGELYTNGDFNIGGSGQFNWLYHVSLQEPSTGTSGMPPTQFKSAY